MCIIHIVTHNGFKMLNEPFKLEIKEENRWRFDKNILENKKDLPST